MIKDFLSNIWNIGQCFRYSSEFFSSGLAMECFLFLILRSEERVEEVYFEIKLSNKFDYFQVCMKI